MSAVAHPPVRHVVAPVEQPVYAEPVEAVEAPPFSSHEMHRWVLVLVTPFVVGASFFALAIGLGEQWPMVPGFLLGPLVLIAGYIYLSLTSEANARS